MSNGETARDAGVTPKGAAPGDPDGSGPGGFDALGAAEAVREGRVSPADLLADAHARVRVWEPWLGAVVTEVGRLGAGAGPLAGVVAGVKEIFDVAGTPTTCGAPAFLGDPGPAARDATVVARLSRAGASVLATLASHPLAYGIITPQTRNPRAPDRIAGGSSGGSAAALAAGLVHVALGSDTGGSVRIPAACCGVVGLKTTNGLVPRDGLAELATSLDTIGPLATSVADARLAFEVITGRELPPRGSQPASRPETLRIGVPTQLREMPVDPDVRAVWEATLADLEAAGSEIIELDLPPLVEASRANSIIIAAEAAAVHGERFAELGDLLPAETTRAYLTRGVGMDPGRVDEARHVGARLRAALKHTFTRVDLLCTPTLPCRAPDVGSDRVTVEGIDEHVGSAVVRLTGPWNLAGVPAGSVPAGRDGGGAPVGVQLIGPWWTEERVLDGLALVERLRGGPWPTEPPPRT